MRWGWIALNTAALALSATAFADDALPKVDAELNQEQTSHKLIGLMVDLGLPDGASVSLVARPLCWLRLHAGASHNTVNFGIRGGATVGTCFSVFNPTLTLEAGHFFEGDANKIARTISGNADLDVPVFRRFGYSYANAQVGAEFGFETFTFYLRGGMSVLQTRIHLAEASVEGELGLSDMNVRGYGVSAKLGMIFYLF